MSPDDFSPDVEPAERAELKRLARRLVAERPVPSPMFRGDLGRRLTARRPRRQVRRRVAAYVTSGVALLALAGVGAAGAGPLAPHPLQQPDVIQASVR